MKNSNICHLLGIALVMAFVIGLPGQIRAESITDENGTVIDFERPFTRIISLYPAHTENLFTLGLDEQIIGVSKNDTYPEQAASKPKFHYREDPEKFMAARPDLVLVRPMIVHGYPDLIAKLNLAGITVVSLQPSSIEETYDYWRVLGKLTGRTSEAETMIDHFKNKLAELRGRTSGIADRERQKVYFEAIHKKMKTFSPTSISIFVLEAAGGINIAGDAEPVRNTNIAYYGKEKILAKALAIDVFLAQSGKMNRISSELLKNEPGFSAIKAMQNNHIYIVDETVVSRPTMRLLSGIEEIQRVLYPQVYE